MSNKHDWSAGADGQPKFNASKYGQAATVEGQRVVVDPSMTGRGEVVPTARGGQIQGYTPYFIDGSDAMANKGFILSFQHVPSEEDVNFKAFISAFNETYNCDWGSETVYGRADPIHMFKNTTREINLTFMVPASTEGEAFENLARVQRLITFLYPTYEGELYGGNNSSHRGGAVYEDAINALNISNSPLVRLRVMNLLAARPQIGDAAGSSRSAEESVYSTLGTFERHVADGGGGEWPTTSMGSNVIAKNFHGGLLGIIKNVSVNHNIENPDLGSFEINKGIIFPKAIEVAITFSAIHEHTLGWIKHGTTQKFANPLFPYGVNDQSSNMFDEGATDVSSLQSANLHNYGSMMGGEAARRAGIDDTEDDLDSVDQLEDRVRQNDQDLANAEARYAGLTGRARFNRDERRLERLDNRIRRREGRGAKTEAAQSRRDYIESSRRGVTGPDGTGTYDEFIGG